MSDVNPSTTMTFLFTDIEGSTEQWELLSDMHERVDAHFAALQDAVERNGGEVFATMGDGIAAAFPSVDAAVQAAIAGQRGMPATGLSVRMGIHTGEVERVDDDFRGRPVNRAARIMAAGHGGQILLSDLSATLVRTGPCPVEMTDLGTHRLRDLTAPERIWQVLAPDLLEAFPPVRGLDTYSNNLPAQRSSLIGREPEVQRVIDLVRHHRIVTLTGVGGVGKTRLAIQAAADLLARFANTWFIELASVGDPDDVADTIALTLGARAITDPIGAIATLLAGEETLLVVDNCEHVVDTAAAAIDQLVARCPGLRVIITSREALGIDGEQVRAVRSLDPSSTAVELFQQRAEAAGADVAGLDRSMVEHVCRRLDGIPLAIELAAARVVTLGVAAIVDALDDRFSLLNGGRRRAVDRHGTMRATIDWSYRLLGPDEQRLFQRLAVFSNGFELDAVRHVSTAIGIDGHHAVEHLASLVHKSMIVPEAHDRGVRYRMLETMRAFALERLDERGDRLQAVTALAEWMATVTEASVDDPCTAAVERSIIRLEREADNWREAVMLAIRSRNEELAGRLCGPATSFFLLGRHDLADLVQPMLDLCTGESRHRRSVLCALSVASAGSVGAEQLGAWADELQTLDDREPTGVGPLIRWLALAWTGDFVASIDVCIDASLDERHGPGVRDLFVGIATLDHFSLTDAAVDRCQLIDRALEVAERSEVAISRVTCRLGAAWGLIDVDPNRAVHLVKLALDDIMNVPPLTRLTLPGSASRLLTRLDPQVAAVGLLAQLGASTSRRSFIEFIPVFYACALLHRVGHPSAGSALATLTVSPIAPYLSMMDFVDVARHAAVTSNIGSLRELEANVRSALADIVAGRDESALQFRHAPEFAPAPKEVTSG